MNLLVFIRLPVPSKKKIFIPKEMRSEHASTVGKYIKVERSSNREMSNSWHALEATPKWALDGCCSELGQQHIWALSLIMLVTVEGK